MKNTKKIINERLCISANNPVRIRFYDYEKFTYPWHFHSEYELIYVEQGHGQCLVGDNIIDFSDNCVILFGSSLPHCMQSSTEECPRVCGVNIQFEKNFMQYSFANYVQFVSIHKLFIDADRGIKYNLDNYPKIKDLLKKIPTLDGLDQMLTLIKLLQLLSQIPQKELVTSPNYAPVLIGYKDKKIEKVIAYLNKEYNRKICLKEIASFAAMNPSSFCRYFKKNIGKSFKEYITDMRIGYACKLLSTDKFNISQISIECGFDTITHFNRCFKRITGITPTEYKKKYDYPSVEG